MACVDDGAVRPFPIEASKPHQAVPAEPTRPPTSLHRISTVRRQQGLSLRSAARHLGLDIREVRRQECESADIRLSELFQWQQALEVPIADLLVDPGTPLSRPVLERAQLLRLMKTAAAIREQAPNAATQRMAETLIEQLTEIMPELKSVAPWHAVGQRRSLDEYGRIAERPIADDCVL